MPAICFKSSTPFHHVVTLARYYESQLKCCAICFRFHGPNAPLTWTSKVALADFIVHVSSWIGGGTVASEVVGHMKTSIRNQKLQQTGVGHV